MRLVDERGRLFGRFNIIDVAVVLLLLALIPAAYVAYRLFRQPAPVITAVTPNHIVEQTPTTVEVHGEYLRAFLNARIGTIAAPAFLIQRTTTGELKVPALPPGTYDLTLLEENTEVTRMPAALVVTPSPRRLATIRVRFVALPELLSRLRAGDTTVSGTSGGEDDRVVITDVGSDRQNVRATVTSGRTAGPQSAADGADRRMPFQVEQDMVAFTATLRLPVVSSAAGWTFRNRPIKIGEPFTFESTIGIMDGLILDVELPQDR